MLLNALFFGMRRGTNYLCFFFSSRRRHTSWTGDWSSDVCSSDLELGRRLLAPARRDARIVRRLGRTIKLGPQFGEFGPKRRPLRAQPLDRLRLRLRHADQSFPIQRIKCGAPHPQLESEHDSYVKARPAHTLPRG